MDSSDRRSIEAAFKENLITVYRIAYTFLGDAGQAEEASQRAFSRYFGYHDTEDTMQERPALMIKVTEACYGMRGGDSAAPEQGVQDMTLRAMAALPDKYKLAAYLFFGEGLTTREIASILEDKPAAVTAMVDRARRQLRSKLGPDFEDDGRIPQAYNAIGPDAASAGRIWRGIHSEDGEEPMPDESGWVSYAAAAGKGIRDEAPENIGAVGQERRPASRRELREKEKGFVEGLPKPALIAGAAVILVLVIVLAISFFGKKAKPADAPANEPILATPGEADSTDLSEALAYEAPADVMKKLDNAQAALKEWTEYKNTKTQAFYTEKLPKAGAFIDASAAYDGTDVEQNSDGTYTLYHWSYMEDWANTSVSPVTGQTVPSLVQVRDDNNIVTIDQSEYANYMEYMEQLAQGGYGDYSYIYAVADQEEAMKLEEIAAKYSLKPRTAQETINGFGEAGDTELMTALSQIVGKGDVYTAAPQFDHFAVYQEGSFLSLADIILPDGRRMYTSLCATLYDEMVDGRQAGGFTVSKAGEMSSRSYTAADGTPLTIAQNDSQAIVYAYLDNCYVVLDMSIDPWRQSPGSGETAESLSAKRETDFTVTEELVNHVADSINYKNIGK